MRLQVVSPFSMALIAAIWNGSCMKALLGTVLSSKVRMRRGLPQGVPESPVIFTMIMELVLQDLIKSWRTLKLGWRLDDFVLPANCYADEVVLVAASVAACGSDGGRGHCKAERCRSECWCTENTLDESPEDGGRKKSWWTDWLCCGRKSWSLWE